MLNEEQLQIITLKASYVHEHADRPYFRNELNRVGETLHEAAYLNFFVRYRTESAHKNSIDANRTNNDSNTFSGEGSPSRSTHRWSRINKVIYLSEWNDRLNNNNNSSSNANYNTYSNSTLPERSSSSCAQYDPLANSTRNESQLHQQQHEQQQQQQISSGRPQLVIDTSFSENGLQVPSWETQVALETNLPRQQSALPSYIIWRQKTFWVALMVEGEAEPVLISRLSTKPPTEDEVAAFCSHQMHCHPGQTYRDGELEEDRSKVVAHEERKQTERNPETDNANTTNYNENVDKSEYDSNNDQQNERKDDVYDIWGSSFDPRDYLPTHTQIDKLRQFRQRRITQHQWTDDEILEAKELNARFSQAGVAATPVGSTLNKLHNMKLESELSLAQRIRLGDTHALSAATIAAASKGINNNNMNKSVHEYGNWSEMHSQTFASMSGSPGLMESASSPQSSSSLLVEMSGSSRRVPRFDEVNPLTQLPTRKRKRDFMAEESRHNTEQLLKNDMHETYNDNSSTITASHTSTINTSQNVLLPPSSPHSPFLPRKLKERALQQFIKSASNTSSAHDANSSTTHATSFQHVGSAYDDNIDNSNDEMDGYNNDGNYPWERSTSVYGNNNSDHNNYNNNTSFSPSSFMNATPRSNEELEGNNNTLPSHVVDEETIEQWRKMAEQERAFYTYISNPDRSAYLNKVTAISIRNAELNKRNRRRGIANERRLERKGNLLESGGLWVTDDAERARKAAEYKASLEMTGLNDKIADKSNSANAQKNAQVSTRQQINGKDAGSSNNTKRGATSMETGHAQHTTTRTTTTPTYDFGSLMNELFDAELQEQTTCASASTSETTHSNQEHLTETADSKTDTCKDHVHRDEEELASPTRNLLLSETRYRLIRFDELSPLTKGTEKSEGKRTNFSNSRTANMHENDHSYHRNDECNNSCSSFSNNNSLSNLMASSSSPLLVTSQLLHYSAAHSARRKLSKDKTLHSNMPQTHEVSSNVTVDDTANSNTTDTNYTMKSKKTVTDEAQGVKDSSTLDVVNEDSNKNNTNDDKSLV